MRTVLAATLAVLMVFSIDCHSGEVTRIFLAGDSTMAEKLPEKRPETGWGEMLQTWFPPSDVVVVNHAVNGRSTRTFIEEGRWDAVLKQLRPGDYVFIQFGHNDQSEQKPKRYTPPEQFLTNLSQFIADVSNKEATAVLLTPVVRRRFDDTGQFYDVHGVYPNLVREAARESGAPLIDLHRSSTIFLEEYGAERSKELFLWLQAGEYDSYPEGLEDNTHFSPLGARVMASLVMQDILNSELGLAQFIQKLPNSVVHESDISKAQGGPHSGGGETTAHPFFDEFPELGFVFRKRIMHPGSTIGYHLHDKDEIYYILEGHGELTLNGVRSEVGPGTAILTRPGDSHGLKPLDGKDLVLMIVYEKRG